MGNTLVTLWDRRADTLNPFIKEVCHVGRYIQSDMRRVELDGEFNAAFNWFGSFGYFSEADNETYSSSQAWRKGSAWVGFE